jgi:hypothetical protein
MKSPGVVNSVTFISNEIKQMYKSVMSVEQSPLKNFDPIVAHMLFQVLALVWSGVFAVMVGSYIVFGISAALHIIFISGILITVLVFREANKQSLVKNLNKHNGRAVGGEHE